MKIKCLFALTVIILAFTHIQASQTRKVLIIGIDGVRSDALQQANTPNIDGLLPTSLYTFNAYTCGLTIDGPAWSDMMTGVWNAKHGVTNNNYTNSNFNTYPYFTKRAKDLNPNLYAVQVTDWAPMSDNIYNDGFDNKVITADGDGAATATAAITELANNNLDALFVHFDGVDLEGHTSGFSPSNPAYIAAIEEVDGNIGSILSALYARPNYANEDWLVIIVTDHGGIGTGHGGGSNEERNIWWIANGDAVAHQQLTGGDPGTYNSAYQLNNGVASVNPNVFAYSPTLTDVSVTALHHLIFDLSINPEDQVVWDLDGKSWLDTTTTDTTVTPPSALERKVLIIGIDGVRSDAIQQANTPNIDGLLPNALYTFNAYSCGLTIDGPAWSDMMTGVWEDKHGVTNNNYTGSNFNTYPYFAKRAKELMPNLYAVQVTDWAPMSDLVYNDGWDEKILQPDSDGPSTAAAAVTALTDDSLDALFVHFNGVDLEGHTSGFSPSNPAYIAAIEEVDGYIGTILNALYTRSNYANEDWLIIITTDHGGLGSGHGGGSDAERKIWWIANGNAVVHQQLAGGDPGTYQASYQLSNSVPPVNASVFDYSPTITDVGVTALHHLIYNLGINPENELGWDLDGKSWLDTTSTDTLITAASFHNNQSITIYPNPTNGNYVLIAYSSPFAKVMVTDIFGRTFINQSANGQSALVNISELTSGIFFVQIFDRQGNRLAEEKVLKN